MYTFRIREKKERRREVEGEDKGQKDKLIKWDCHPELRTSSTSKQTARRSAASSMRGM